MTVYTGKSDAGGGARALLLGICRQKSYKLVTDFQHPADTANRYAAPILYKLIKSVHKRCPVRGESITLSCDSSPHNNSAHSYRGYGSHFDIHLI